MHLAALCRGVIKARGRRRADKKRSAPVNGALLPVSVKRCVSVAAAGTRGGCAARSRGQAGDAGGRLDAVAVRVDEADLYVAAVGELERVGEAQVLARAVRVQ